TNKYEITVDGGEPFQVEHGDTIPEEKIPAKEDTETQYFKGWTVTYEDGTFENIPADEIDEYQVTKPATITPWYVDKDKKVVTFYNGSATHETQDIPEGGKATKPATDPEKDGAEFKYWGASEDAEEAFDFENTPINDDTKIYAVYEYTISFSGTSFADQKVLHGKTVANPGEATAEGMTFKHWSLTAGGEAYDFTTKVTESFSLYAVFVPVTSEKFDVVFKVDGSEVHSEEVNDGGYAEGPDADPEDTAEKYFAGWIVEGDASETVVDLTTYVIEADTVFVALYKNKLVVTFYDLSLDDEPLHTAYVVPGETLTDNQYPHHEDNLGAGVLDYGTPGYEKNADIHSVYEGVDYVHTIPMIYWYLADESDKVWTAFDSDVVINEDTDIHLNIKEVNVVVDAPQLNSTVGLAMWAPYDGETRVIDTVKDMLFISEDTVLNGINAVEDEVMGKLIERGLVDEDYNIKNIHKEITLVKVLGEANINKYIWEFVGDSASDEDVNKDTQKKAYVNQLVDELCAEKDVTVTADRLFMFEPILEKLEKFNY
ncbi:MAG: InlB B-repeat-containing protein, partial [Clostridia bacterium]|nr:InlB B-repeat-containing protein [Clostridia bacterium]